MSEFNTLNWYTIYRDPWVDQAIIDMIKWSDNIVIWLIFNGNSFQMVNINDYLASKVNELVWKKLSEQ